MLRLADVHPSVEKGSVRIWPFCRHSPSSSSRLVGSARVAATGIGNRSGEVRRGRRSFARDRYHSAGYLLSLLGRARQTDGGARGALHRRTPPDRQRGKSDSYGGLLSSSPSVNPSLLSGSLDAHPAVSPLVTAVVYAQPSTLHLTSIVLLRCRPSCNDGPIMEPSHINPRSSLPSRLLPKPNRRRRRFFGQQVRARCPEAPWS